MRMSVLVCGLLLCNSAVCLSAAQCPNDSTPCGGASSHMCMAPYNRCDGQEDSQWCSGSGDDERGCEGFQCPGLRTPCGGSTHLCMAPKNRCDGQEDIQWCGGSGDDERGCEGYECEHGREKCGGTSGLCVYERHRCDKTIDLSTCGGNGDDERDCPPVAKPPTSKPNGSRSTPPTTGHATNLTTGNGTNSTTGNGTNPTTGKADGNLTSENTETGQPVDDTEADIPAGRRQIQAIKKVEDESTSTDPLAKWAMAVGVPMVLAAGIWMAAASLVKKREKQQAAGNTPLQENNTPPQDDNTPPYEDNTPPQETVDETVV